MEVAAALLDASRKLSSEKDNFKGGSSTGNVSMGSSSSFSSGNEQTGATASSSNTPSSSSWLTNPWAGERKRTMSDCVSSSEQLSTLTWLGGWSLSPRSDLGSGGQGKEARRPQGPADQRTRRASCKGIESAMAGGMGKVWYDS